MILVKQLDNQIGGAERQTSYLVKELDKRKLPYRISYIKTPFVFDAITTLAKVIRYRPRTVYFMLGIAPHSFRQLLSLTIPYLIISLLGKLAGTRFVVRLVKSDDYERLSQFIPRSILEKLDYVCLSKSERRFILRRNSKSRVAYLVNGVDTNVFRPMPKSIAKKFTFGYIGSFSKEKNLSLLIRSYAMLPIRVRKRSRLLLIGANPPNCCDECKESALKIFHEIRRFNLENEVIVKPYVPLLDTKSLVKMYNSFDVTVSASAQEGCPNMILESLACSVPVVFYSKPKEIAEVADKNVSFRFNLLKESSIVNELQTVYDRSYSKKQACRPYAIKHLALQGAIEKSISFLML